MSFKVSNNIIGFDNDLTFFIKLYKNNILPNTILFQGLEGIGKYTFVLNLISTVLGKKNADNLEDCLNYNQNILILKKKENIKEFKFEEIKSIINFCKLKTLDEKPKFIVIKDCNFLNKSSINALLKLTEEVKNNTYFFFTSNLLLNVSKTLESRFFKKKLFLNNKFYNKIIINFFKNNNIQRSNLEICTKDTPGVYIKKYFFSLDGNLENLKKINEDLFYKIVAEKIIDKSNEEHIPILKRLKLNLFLKNDINSILKKL